MGSKTETAKTIAKGVVKVAGVIAAVAPIITSALGDKKK